MQPKNNPKNIVLISLDDAVAFWKYKTIFKETLQTPNLDRICAESTAFHAAYCQAPVCSPSRACFMSGKSPHQSGVLGSDKRYFEKIPPEEMWPYTLKQNGMYCSSGGKVMRGYGPLPREIHTTLFSDRLRRFDVERRKNYYEAKGETDPIKKMEFGGFRDGVATVDEKDDGTFYDHQIADSAIRFLENYNSEAPFYREVGFSGPHGPWSTPRRFKEMYNFRNIKKPADWKAGFEKSAIMDKDAPENIDTSRLRYWKNSVRNYFSALTHVDHHLGRVWDAIKASPHADNTLIVLVSDHGLHLGERNRFRKHTLWEQVANVPLIIHDPSRPVAQVVTDPVGLIDIGPTVMDYMGLPPIKDTVGRSLRPQVEWERDPDRAVPTFINQNAAIRKGKYRFIRYEDGTTQMFDLSEDWWGTNNLGKDHPDYAEMSAAHAATCKEYGYVFEMEKVARSLAFQ